MQRASGRRVLGELRRVAADVVPVGLVGDLEMEARLEVEIAHQARGQPSSSWRWAIRGHATTGRADLRRNQPRSVDRDLLDLAAALRPRVEALEVVVDEGAEGQQRLTADVIELAAKLAGGPGGPEQLGASADRAELDADVLAA